MPSTSEISIDPHVPALLSGPAAAAPASMLRKSAVVRLSESAGLARPGIVALVAKCCMVSAGLHFTLFVVLIWISTVWFRLYHVEFSGLTTAECIDSSFSDAGSQAGEPIEFSAVPLDLLLNEPFEDDPARTMAVRQERVEPPQSAQRPGRDPDVEPLDLDHRPVEQRELPLSHRAERGPRATRPSAVTQAAELPPVERTRSADQVLLQSEPVRTGTARAVPKPVVAMELPETVAVASASRVDEPFNRPAQPIELATEAPTEQADNSAASVASQATPQNLGTRRTPVQAQYTPAPQYPADSVRLREEGRVLLRVIITSGGRVSSAKVVETSGFSRLDDAAVEAVSDWRFSAAKDDGQPVSSSVLLPIRFRL